MFPLLGRRAECERLDGWLAAARHGHGGGLVVRGEPGVGKSALLDYVVDRAAGFRVLLATGVEAERELPFAALHQVCAPMLPGLAALPGPQQDALAVTFGMRTGAAPERLLVGLAVLGLLSDAAAGQPLLCVVDDAQWLDSASAQALAFVAHRLAAEPFGLAFATRGPSEELRGLPEIVLGGLHPAEARVLLGSVLRAPLDEPVFERILAETRGNPLALLELPRAATPAELAGGFGLPDATSLSDRIEASFRRRVTALPPETQRLVLIAAAEPVGDPLLLRRAAAHEGIDIAALAPAEADGLLAVDARVAFRHPLVRSAVYRAATQPDQRAAHRALAAVTDARLDPDRHAWHRAQAASGPDEDVAEELEHSAGRARARGGIAAAAAFLERAATLTPDPARRGERALAAAQAKYGAGAYDSALGLLVTAAAGPVSVHHAAEADLLRGQIEFARSFGSDAPALLLAAARRFEALDVGRARDTYLHALAAALLAGQLSDTDYIRQIADAARRIPRRPGAVRPHDLLLDGLVTLVADGYRAGAPLLRQAVAAFLDTALPTEEGLRWLWLAGHAAGLLWDHENWHALSARLLRGARDAGALSALPVALNTHAGALLFAGQLVLVAPLVGEIKAVTHVTSAGITPYAELGLAAFRGDATEATPLIEATNEDVLRRGEGVGLTFLQWAAAVLHNGLTRYADALTAARQAAGDQAVQRFRNWALVELVEAATRTGDRDAARDAFGRLAETTRASGTDWAKGIEARCAALLATGQDADDLHRTAISRLRATSARVDLARACLNYGEWLRRSRRRVAARDPLREAHELFAEFGMTAFAERARTELQATGERARRRVPDTRDDLTPQETQVSLLAAEGATNAEIAARLFISASTVDYHLRKVFRKLGVTSRTQLVRQILDHRPS